jgi:hypothetical protein
MPADHDLGSVLDFDALGNVHRPAGYRPRHRKEAPR